MSLIELTSRANALVDYAHRRNLPQPYHISIHPGRALVVRLNNGADLSEWERSWPETFQVTEDSVTAELHIQFHGAPVRVVAYKYQGVK